MVARPPVKYVFSSKAYAKLSRACVETLGPLLVQLGEKRVSSVPRALVDLARPKSHPAHRFFEWDDTKAGEAYRLEQARRYQQTITYEVVVHRSSKPTRTSMRVVYPIKDEDGKPGYMTGSAVTRDVDAMSQLVEQALRQIEVWKNTYNGLRDVAELQGIFKEVEKVLATRRLKIAAE